jgi:hypothetical protein
MAKAKNKTTANKLSVSTFLNGIEDNQKRKDAKAIAKLMKEVTGENPVMWGKSIVGYGQYHYIYDSGREGDFLIIGFSPRKASLTIYIMPGYQNYGDLMKTLGPHKLGKSCLYIRKLENIHLPTLKKLIKRGYTDMKKKYG